MGLCGTCQVFPSFFSPLYQGATCPGKAPFYCSSPKISNSPSQLHFWLQQPRLKVKRWHFPYTVCPPSARQPQASRVYCLGHWRGSNILGVLCRAWLGCMGSGNFHGAGRAAQSQSPAPRPCHVTPRVSRGSQGLCATPALALPPPPLSPCKAEHWDGQNSPGGPGQDRTPGTGWGSQIPLAAAPSVVSEGTGMCVSSPTTVWCPPTSTAGRDTALGMPLGSSGKDTLGRSCLHP